MSPTATDKGTFDPEMLAATPEGETILNALMVERTVPLTEVSEWTFEVPLVLVDTDYAPFTERARPDGRIIWIDPSDEARYLAMTRAARAAFEDRLRWNVWGATVEAEIRALGRKVNGD